MMTGKTICFLLFFIYIVSTQLIQKDVDEFIRNQNFIPPTATMSSFKEENGKGIAIYKDGNTKFKIIVGKNYSLGQMFLIFREQQTEINFSNGFVQTSNRHINNFPFPAHQ
jgi:ABC-type Na+ efflux pump permease subunit